MKRSGTSPNCIDTVGTVSLSTDTCWILKIITDNLVDRLN